MRDPDDKSATSGNDPSEHQTREERRRAAEQLILPEMPQTGVALVRAHLSKGDLCGYDVVAAFRTKADAEEYCRLKDITLQGFGGWSDWDSFEIWAIRDGRVEERS